ncbi:hypothetical protein PEBR_41904 [Penicillium brasilianum]|uniref:Methyltransferase domain-containing protein n=1 Tax=Penicillium brasilianum TaxID=104259 RepID=A0A1S9R9L9_PENBI|nr:hypothetical protein PEBR_41904 [Penicillium brasilianum]
MSEPQVDSPGEYVMIRSKSEGERLDKQYGVWQANTGFLLHPTIAQKQRMRIADVGTGTGIWLRDLANTLPKDCQLDGFDLSESMFFKDTTIPSNVSFYQHNLLEPFPTKFIGQYDVVNARALVVALSHDEWEPALRNLTTLLQPGGYVQWLDCSVTDFVVKGATNDQVPTNAERWIELLQTTANTLGKTPNVASLHGLFQKSGLEACEEQIYQLDNPTVRDVLNSAVLEGIQNFMIAALKIRKFDSVDSVDQVMEMRMAAEKDLRDLGCWFSYKVYVVVGRKA